MIHQSARRSAALLAALGAFSVLFLAGCGGGGGSGDNGSSIAVIGKVVIDNTQNTNPPSATVVPGARVSVEGGGPQTTTLSQGGFRLENVGDGVRRLDASTNIHGVNYTGSTQVLAIGGVTVSNANIQVSPDNQQATIKGNVYDAVSGRPLQDARVFLAVTVNSSGDDASLVAFADNQGRYEMRNVPISDAQGRPIGYQMAASLPGSSFNPAYHNDYRTIGNLQAGQTVTGADFYLSQSGGSSGLQTPSGVFVQSFTQPSSIANAPHLRSAHEAAPSSVYEKIRRLLSPKYAALVSQEHAAAKTVRLSQKRQSRQFADYAIENDVSFTNTNQPDTLAGFRIYLSQGAQSLQAYDFLQDPLANFYMDLDPFYVPNQQYNFAVSAVGTDGAETSLSDSVTASSVIPLDLVRLSQPGPGQTLNNPVTIAWASVQGAQAYAIFVYTEFPSFDSAPLPIVANDPNNPMSGNQTSYTVPAALASGDYYVVVAASADSGGEISVSQITKFHVP